MASNRHRLMNRMFASVAISASIGLSTYSAEAGEFDGCGLLVQGVECVLFQSFDFPFGLLVLDDLGTFGVGDVVHVAGDLDLGCFNTCLQGPGCIHNVCIALCTEECLSCPWDLDGRGSVDVPDLLALLAAWDTNPCGPPDFNGDGAVNVPDLLTLLAAWGPCP